MEKYMMKRTKRERKTRIRINNIKWQQRKNAGICRDMRNGQSR